MKQRVGDFRDKFSFDRIMNTSLLDKLYEYFLAQAHNVVKGDSGGPWIGRPTVD